MKNLLTFITNVTKIHQLMCEGHVLSSKLVFTSLYVDSSIENVTEHLVLYVHHYFVNFALQPATQTKFKV
jgi:hypothetical protein